MSIHEVGYVHYDLHEKNLFITQGEDPICQVGDLGTAMPDDTPPPENLSELAVDPGFFLLEGDYKPVDIYLFGKMLRSIDERLRARAIASEEVAAFHDFCKRFLPSMLTTETPWARPTIHELASYLR